MDNEEPGVAVMEIFLDLKGNAKVISIEEEEVHSMSEVTAFEEDDSPAEETMQTIQGNAGESYTATCTVTFVQEKHENAEYTLIMQGLTKSLR